MFYHIMVTGVYTRKNPLAVGPGGVTNVEKFRGARQRVAANAAVFAPGLNPVKFWRRATTNVALLMEAGESVAEADRLSPAGLPVLPPLIARVRHGDSLIRHSL